MMQDLMIDIETLGDVAGSIVTSISAVPFDIETGETGSPFNMSIKLDDSIGLGFGIRAGTILWWLAQSNEARNRMIKDQETARNLHEVLFEFRSYVKSFGSNVKLWGNNAKFDMGIIEALYVKTRFTDELPWNTRNERCVRTYFALYPQARLNEPFVGTAHVGIDDCYHQIKVITKIHNIIKDRIKGSVLNVNTTAIPEKSKWDNFELEFLKAEKKRSGDSEKCENVNIERHHPETYQDLEKHYPAQKKPIIIDEDGPMSPMTELSIDRDLRFEKSLNK